MDIKLISNLGTYKQFLKVTLRPISLKVIGTLPIPEALILLILPQEIEVVIGVKDLNKALLLIIWVVAPESNKNVLLFIGDVI